MDPEFLDDILVLVKSFDEIGQVFDMLVDALQHVGLVFFFPSAPFSTAESPNLGLFY